MTLRVELSLLLLLVERSIIFLHFAGNSTHALGEQIRSRQASVYNAQTASLKKMKGMLGLSC